MIGRFYFFPFKFKFYIHLLICAYIVCVGILLCLKILQFSFILTLLMLKSSLILYFLVGCPWWYRWKSAKSSGLPSGLFFTCSKNQKCLAYFISSCTLVLSFCYLQIRLRDYGVLDFDANDARRQPPVDTTWQQVLIPFRILQVFTLISFSLRKKKKVFTSIRFVANVVHI